MNPSTRRKKCPHVAVCVDQSRSYGRGVLRGIAEYVEAYGPWSLFIDPQAVGTYTQDWLKNWRGDGVLAYIEDPILAERLRHSGIPTVELFGQRFGLGVPQIGNDDAAMGHLAAEHLIERHFKHFAFTGYPGEPWVDRREKGFAAKLAETGFTHEIFLCPRRPKTLAEWEKTQQQLTSWVSRLPKPCGLMACSDRHAQRVLDACRRAGVIVPEEIAVIGVNNDEETCRLSDPPLTSIMDDAKRIGYESAKLLDQIMSGHVKPGKIKPIWIPPVGIVVRRSTDVAAIEDRLVANVMRFIRERACDGLGVDQLLREFNVSRSVLYRRFKDALGRSPHQEVLRVQMDKVKTLLSQTKLSLEKIAELAGFQHTNYLSMAFKREVGMKPGEYRRRLTRGNGVS